MLTRFILFAAVCCCSLSLFANNIQVGTVTVNGNNISFNLSWENSWNSSNNTDPAYPANRDAAWVFVKVQSNTDNLWRHQLLSALSASHAVTGDILQVDAVSDGIGVFVRRTAPGAGAVSGTVTLQMQSLPAGQLNFRVFAIEMVYIPQGAYHLGDGGGVPKFTPLTISSESQSLPAGSIYTNSPSLPNTFPKGFAGVYAMKYELSCEQWVDFLNSLTYHQQENLTEIAPNSAVNTTVYQTGLTNVSTILRIQVSGVNNTVPARYGCNANGNGDFNEAADGQTLACPVLNPRRLLAYLDWSGLRPMTEMEYEKICRGSGIDGNPVPRVNSEYPWGTTDLARYSSNSNVLNAWTPQEVVDGAVVNGRTAANGSSTSRPMRVGLFAGTGTGRLAAGAGFYGNMDLAGNVWEICVAVSGTGTQYTGNHGDGTLSVSPGADNGSANVADWPPVLSNQAYGIRGGGYNNSATTQLQTSDRSFASISFTGVINNIGGRGVRTF